MLESVESGTRTPRYTLQQDERSLSITAHCGALASSSTQEAAEEPRAVAEGRAFGLVYRECYLPLVLPSSCTGVREYSISQDAVTVVVEKQEAALWNLDEVAPGIAPDLVPGSRQLDSPNLADDVAAAVNRANGSASLSRRLTLVDEDEVASLGPPGKADHSIDNCA